MNKHYTILTATILGALSVSIGAFGAHALKPILINAGRLDTFELAVRYQFYHTLALLACGVIMHFYSSSLLNKAAVLFLFGILFFSGSLYILCFTGLGILGAITPIGGLLLITAWVLMFAGVASGSRK